MHVVSEFVHVDNVHIKNENVCNQCMCLLYSLNCNLLPIIVCNMESTDVELCFKYGGYWKCVPKTNKKKMDFTS